MRFKVGAQVIVRIRGGCPGCKARGFHETRELGGPTYRRDCDRCAGRRMVHTSVGGTVVRRMSHEVDGGVVYIVCVPAGPGHRHTGARSRIEVDADKLVAR